MPTSRRSTDLRGRRVALGATSHQMAAGLGIAVRELHAMESGGASDDRLSFYAAWLSRLEAAPSGRRSQLFKRAVDGRRFD